MPIVMPLTVANYMVASSCQGTFDSPQALSKTSYFMSKFIYSLYITI